MNSTIQQIKAEQKTNRAGRVAMTTGLVVAVATATVFTLGVGGWLGLTIGLVIGVVGGAVVANEMFKTLNS